MAEEIRKGFKDKDGRKVRLEGVPDDGKVDKVQNATAGNFAQLTADGGIEDSGKNTNDFMPILRIASLSDLDNITTNGFYRLKVYSGATSEMNKILFVNISSGYKYQYLMTPTGYKYRRKEILPDNIPTEWSNWAEVTYAEATHTHQMSDITNLKLDRTFRDTFWLASNEDEQYNYIIDISKVTDPIQEDIDGISAASIAQIKNLIAFAFADVLEKKPTYYKTLMTNQLFYIESYMWDRATDQDLPDPIRVPSIQYVSEIETGLAHVWTTPHTSYTEVNVDVNIELYLHGMVFKTIVKGVQLTNEYALDYTSAVFEAAWSSHAANYDVFKTLSLGISDITGLQTALDAKASTSDLNGKASKETVERKMDKEYASIILDSTQNDEIIVPTNQQANMVHLWCSITYLESVHIKAHIRAGQDEYDVFGFYMKDSDSTDTYAVIRFYFGNYVIECTADRYTEDMSDENHPEDVQWSCVVYDNCGFLAAYAV